MDEIVSQILEYLTQDKIYDLIREMHDKGFDVSYDEFELLSYHDVRFTNIGLLVGIQVGTAIIIDPRMSPLKRDNVYILLERGSTYVNMIFVKKIGELRSIYGYKRFRVGKLRVSMPHEMMVRRQ